MISESRHCGLRLRVAQFKFSIITSVRVHVQVGALPIVLSESRYMTSVRHSESVVVRLGDSDQLQLEAANAVEAGYTLD